MQWQHTKPAQLNGGTDTKTVPASKIKGKCAGNTPETLILANRPRSNRILMLPQGALNRKGLNTKFEMLELLHFILNFQLILKWLCTFALCQFKQCLHLKWSTHSWNKHIKWSRRLPWLISYHQTKSCVTTFRLPTVLKSWQWIPGEIARRMKTWNCLLGNKWNTQLLVVGNCPVLGYYGHSLVVYL